MATGLLAHIGGGRGGEARADKRQRRSGGGCEHPHARRRGAVGGGDDAPADLGHGAREVGGRSCSAAMRRRQGRETRWRGRAPADKPLAS